MKSKTLNTKNDRWKKSIADNFDGPIEDILFEILGSSITIAKKIVFNFPKLNKKIIFINLMHFGMIVDLVNTILIDS